MRECYVSPHLQNSYVEILAPKVMVLIDENFEMYLCHEDGAPMIGISDLVKEIPKTSPCKNYSEKYTAWKKVLP